MKAYFVTTPIFYVNAAPHIGHLHSALVADVFQSWHRLLNPKLTTATVFATGTDEHGVKVEQAAKKNNCDVQQYCDKISQEYKHVFQKFRINFTHFTRTSQINHREFVSETWQKMIKNDYIYKDKYSGWYCVSDETFLSELQIKDLEIVNEKTGEKSNIKVSLESGHPVEWTVEENYKFRLNYFQNQLIDWLKKNESAIIPKKFHYQVLNNLLENKLEDISVSRPIERVNWAIPVPNDPSQTIYVWFDALCNYLTVSKEKNFTNWPPDIQVIGKDILKFHAIYWPAFLKSLNYDLPKQIFVHSHWTVNDQKMSKSKYNVICPTSISLDFTEEGLRYFLLREAVPHSDGNYSETKMMRILNAELADSMGNLLSRCCNSIALNPHGLYPTYNNDVLNEFLEKYEFNEFFDNLIHLADRVIEPFNNGNFHSVVDLVISLLHKTNAFLNYNKPWHLIKDPKKSLYYETVLHLTMESLRVSAILLQPIIPELSKQVLDKLSIDLNDRFWINAKQLSWNAAKDINQPKKLSNNNMILFQKIFMKNEKKQICNK